MTAPNVHGGHLPRIERFSVAASCRTSFGDINSIALSGTTYDIILRRVTPFTQHGRTGSSVFWADFGRHIQNGECFVEWCSANPSNNIGIESEKQIRPNLHREQQADLLL